MAMSIDQATPGRVSGVQHFECCRSPSFDVAVPVGHCSGVRPLEVGPSLLCVAWSPSLGKHPPPQDVGLGGEEPRNHPVAQRYGLGEVGVRLVVAAKNGGEPAEIVAYGALRRKACTRSSWSPSLWIL
jgi:hypothetical protein